MKSIVIYIMFCIIGIGYFLIIGVDFSTPSAIFSIIIPFFVLFVLQIFKLIVLVRKRLRH